ncbi:MAG: hypothetical protein JWL70_46 [Acidimicrobiia bacterium]|nr:hypothetical protein [Acidimicrobiia bacterium]
MATTKQKQAARQNLEKARAARSSKAASTPKGGSKSSGSKNLTAAQRDDLADAAFAFPKERKEPLTDARHVRNAIARFDQVEGVSDAERDKAWKRITAAARKFDVEVGEKSWRELFSEKR